MEEHHHALSFKGLLPYTICGAVGRVIVTYLPSNHLGELVARYIGGSSDTIAEAFYWLRHLDHSEESTLTHYIKGKMIGTVLSLAPYICASLFGYDVNSRLAGSLIASSFAQSDQLGAFLSIAYYTIKRGGPKKIQDIVKNPVAMTSLGISVVSFIIDYTARIFITPITVESKWFETYLLSLLCLLPVLVGYIKEIHHNDHS